MHRIVRLLLALIVASAFALPARAEAAADRATLQALVESQIAAFQADDEAGAYSFASPSIQGLYPSPGLFMQMVRQAFQPVYRPQQFTFGTVRDGPSGPQLHMYVTGPDGAAYVAEYSFQQQPDGSWRINGCRLIKDTAPTI